MTYSDVVVHVTSLPNIMLETLFLDCTMDLRQTHARRRAVSEISSGIIIDAKALNMYYSMQLDPSH